MMFADTLIPKNILAIFLALATLGLWAQHAEIQHQKLKAARLELDIKTLEADAATRLAAASEQYRSTEHAWSNAQKEVSNETNRLLPQVRVAADRGAVAGAGLRVRAAEVAAHCAQAPDDPGAPPGGASAPGPGVLLADVLGRLEQAGRLVAEEATLRRIKGLACERDYDALTTP